MDVSKLQDEIDELTACFTGQFGHLTKEQLNWRPDTETWSIAQNIEHLIKINESYTPILEKLNTNQLTLSWVAKWNWLCRQFGNMILKSVDPDRKKRIKTFSIWEPQINEQEEHLLSDFIKHQEQLKNQIKAFSHLQKQVIHSPANKNIVYPLGHAFAILVKHEKRHFNQAKEVLEQMSQT